MKTFSYVIKEKNRKISEIKMGKYSSRKYSSAEKLCDFQLKEYFAGKRKKFSVPLFIDGTDFQKKVWKEMMKIPYGETVSYKELARRIGKPKSYRAVANACGANKIPIIIPCHRVVAKDGLGGYSAGIEIKKKLLEIERKNNS